MIDFNKIDEIRGVLAAHSQEIPPLDRVGEWRGPWQVEAAKFIEQHQYFTYQGPVQWTGKTFVLCLYGCAYILEGYPCLAAFPTLRQGGRVMIRRIDSWMRVLEKEYGLKRTQPDSTTEKTWANGGLLCALSTDESATAGVQGYTFAYGMIDEGHEVNPEAIIGPLFSRFELAMQVGYGKLGVIGVGGTKHSLIEHCKTLEDFSSLRYMALSEPGSDYPAIGDMHPDAKAAFERAKRINSQEHFDQFYQCKPVVGGRRLIFSNIVEEVETTGMKTHAVGFDVGSKKDRTVALHITMAGHKYIPGVRAVQIVDRLELPLHARFDDMADEAHNWLRPKFNTGLVARNIGVEINGQGLGFYQALLKRLPTINGVRMSDDADNQGLKSNLIYMLQALDQSGALGCSLPRTRLHLMNLATGTAGADVPLDAELSRHEQLWRARQVFEHSDDLSALLIGYYMIG